MVSNIDFSIFCIVYTSSGIINELVQSQFSKSILTTTSSTLNPSIIKGKGIMASNNKSYSKGGKRSNDMTITTKDSVLSSQRGGYDSMMLTKNNLSDFKQAPHTSQN